MKLAMLLLTLAVSWTSAKSGNVESTSEDLMKRAASQLERLSTFRRPKEPQKPLSEIPAEENGSQSSAREVQIQEEIVEAQKRIDDLRASASAVLQDPRYAAIMQDRIKRSFISGFANKLIGGAVGAVSGLSRGVSGLSSSNSPSEYGSYGHSYQSQFSLWDFKKAIINTLIQAIKAIGGGAIAGGGALVKGGGYLVSAKGRFISSAGDAISSLGKALASSAIIASSKPVYGPPGYSYGHPPAYLPAQADHAYEGPLPSEDVYAGPGNAYNADHSDYAAPSNDDSGDNDAGVLIAKDTKPEHGNDEEHVPSSPGQENSNLAALEESFGGPPKGTSTITKLIGVLNSGQPTVTNQIHQEEQINYYPEHKDQQSPTSGPSLESNYETPHHENNQGNVDSQSYYDYQQNGQIYDSYGTKLETSSPQLAATHTKVHQGNQDNHQSLALQIQGVLNPHLEVPKINDPNTFKDPTNYVDNHYEGNQQHLEPLNIHNFDHHNNHIDHQPIEMFDYYGVPDYSGGAHVINAMSAQPIGFPLPMPVLPHNYPLNNPTGFGHHFHHHPSPGVATLGVWKRMNRRASSLAKKMALSNNGLHIQRSVGYRLLNGKLMRI